MIKVCKASGNGFKSSSTVSIIQCPDKKCYLLIDSGKRSYSLAVRVNTLYRT